MKTRTQIIDQTLEDHEATTGGPDAYSPIIKAELIKRLSEETYLTCSDFAHFGVQCCDAACETEPHYEMNDVILADDQHAWVCCQIRNILIRRTQKLSTDPEEEKEEKLWREAFGLKPDPIEQELHEAAMAAKPDAKKLCYCLQYSDHKEGRKRGHKKVMAIVRHCLSLPGGRPAKGYNVSNPPESGGFCLQCGASVYEENFIPGTSFHNCRRIREHRSQWKSESDRREVAETEQNT